MLFVLMEATTRASEGGSAPSVRMPRRSPPSLTSTRPSPPRPPRGDRRSVDAAKKERIVRFEVDMALALSTCREFGWGRALKRELEEAKLCGSRFALGGQLGALGAPPSIPRPIVPAGEKSRGGVARRRGGAPQREGERSSPAGSGRFEGFCPEGER
ncbi:uncharacterized protein A4U43_C05F34960 [Asparagus officinalis]|uniref:IBH1-like N-terminal domain-containing protein n=1 Tax=Asparagus officinalis TaxID=4686 RepID=A0A5P1F1A3_ASPOF|nr:uncharacterized protein A4U43_C05F34960 [Asparagus officinalis]